MARKALRGDFCCTAGAAIPPKSSRGDPAGVRLRSARMTRAALPVFALVLALSACATAPGAAPADPRATLAGAPTLQGKWTVDLSSEPGQPYTKPMNLTLNADGTATGDFYESEILAGRWKTDRGRTCVSFRTTDGVGPYHTAACLRGERVEGQTWAEGRGFLFNWVAVR